MNIAEHRLADEQRIRQLCEDFATAANGKDLETVMRQYGSELVAFDCIGPVRFTDLASYRRHWEACFEMCQGGFFRMQDLQVQAGEEVAFCHFIAECGGANEQGEIQTGWMRGTRCLRKEAGDWKVVHEHCSMPFDMQSMQVDFSQKP
ncbi:YybH family protein [Stutzerimonas azotifigens]|uniref:YybH family protein n=1 Tax=Stutzerimonas azotifigens TaxID=291995 RepID=UPI0003FB6C41|nr:nuclear transport factor 2 family protein [Stutzerimonas azotifigens]